MVNYCYFDNTLAQQRYEHGFKKAGAFSNRLSQEMGSTRNGVKSTVDPCSKLISVKSRLDPSDLKMK